MHVCCFVFVLFVLFPLKYAFLADTPMSFQITLSLASDFLIVLSLRIWRTAGSAECGGVGRGWGPRCDGCEGKGATVRARVRC